MKKLDDIIHWCRCGQPWVPAAGLGTTEGVECPGCVLRKLRAADQSLIAEKERENEGLRAIIQTTIERLDAAIKGIP